MNLQSPYVKRNIKVLDKNKNIVKEKTKTFWKVEKWEWLRKHLNYENFPANTYNVTDTIIVVVNFTVNGINNTIFV